MNIAKLSCAVFFAAISIIIFSFPANAQNFGKLFTVDSVSDAVDAAPGDGLCSDQAGHCTLRAAIQEANITPATRDAIIFALPNPSIIDLSLGELAITSRIAIVGPGARRLTVQRSSAGGAEFRIFHITAAQSGTIIRGIQIKNGNAGSAGSGGGIYVDTPVSVQLSDLWVVNNSAGNGGGIASSGTVSLSRTLIESNSATIGGGIQNSLSTSNLTVVNSTIAQNSAVTAGGGINNKGTLALINSTLAQNAALSQCDAVCNDGTASAINTIFGRDDATATHSLAGAFTSNGNNIVVDPVMTTGFIDGVNNDQVSNETRTVDPMLGILGNNGGETDTLALLNGSPAIDRGNSCVTTGNCPNTQFLIIRTDQRTGYFRGFFTTVDVGAFEFNAPMGAGAASFEIFSPNRPAFFGGSISVLTNAVSGEKRFAAVNPVGRIRFQNLPTGVWVMELRSKRAAVGMDPAVLSSEEFPPISLREAGFELRIVEDNNPKK
jgi:CSLREA domain-containing protein